MIGKMKNNKLVLMDYFDKIEENINELAIDKDGNINKKMTALIEEFGETAQDVLDKNHTKIISECSDTCSVLAQLMLYHVDKNQLKKCFNNSFYNPEIDIQQFIDSVNYDKNLDIYNYINFLLMEFGDISELIIKQRCIGTVLNKTITQRCIDCFLQFIEIMKYYNDDSELISFYLFNSANKLY